MGYATLLRAYLVAQTAGVASHIPGGYGVFELAMVALLPASTPSARVALVAALLLFRVVYYLLPLLTAGVLAAVVELRAGRRSPASAIQPAVRVGFVDGGVASGR